jgi:hypothetical protein
MGGIHFQEEGCKNMVGAFVKVLEVIKNKRKDDKDDIK